ncbi:glycosyltransferase family 4 protein [Planctomycetota bacterium]|nr:glycosyltransferase family 4 protein [Planctomycetota bacterium]
MRVTQYLRHPRPGAHSIEAIVDTLSSELSSEMEIVRHVSPFPSRGVVPRLRSMVSAWRHRSEVNHVTGDEHYLALALPRRSVILTIHDLHHLETLRGLRGWFARLLWIHLPVRHSAIITAISEASREQILRITGCDPAKVVVIPNPLAPGFGPCPPPNNETPRILAVGTKRNKNLERLTESIAGLEVELHVLGPLTNDQRRRLEDLQVEHVQHTNLSQAEVVELYRSVDLVAFPSLAEGFGMPIIEAQSVGRPVLTSDRSPMKEVAGDAAWLVDPNSTENIREGIRSILSDTTLRESLVNKGFTNASRYTRTAIAFRYARTFREAIVRV